MEHTAEAECDQASKLESLLRITFANIPFAGTTGASVPSGSTTTQHRTPGCFTSQGAGIVPAKQAGPCWPVLLPDNKELTRAWTHVVTHAAGPLSARTDEVQGLVHMTPCYCLSKG